MVGVCTSSPYTGSGLQQQQRAPSSSMSGSERRGPESAASVQHRHPTPPLSGEATYTNPPPLSVNPPSRATNPQTQGMNPPPPPLGFSSASLGPRFQEPPSPSPCPSCRGGLLVQKDSKYGPFVACSMFPDCKYRVTPTPEARGAGGGPPKKDDDSPSAWLELVSAEAFALYVDTSHQVSYPAIQYPPSKASPSQAHHMLYSYSSSMLDMSPNTC